MDVQCMSSFVSLVDLRYDHRERLYYLCERAGGNKKEKKEQWCNCVSFNQHALPSFELYKHDAIYPI